MDGCVVMFSRDRAFGAFRVETYDAARRVVEYSWLLSERGPDGFFETPGTDACTTVEFDDAELFHRLRIGAVEIGYARAMSTRPDVRRAGGWPLFAADHRTSLCVTTERDFRSPELRSGRWLFRRFPADPGSVLTERPDEFAAMPRLVEVTPAAVPWDVDAEGSRVVPAVWRPAVADGTTVLLYRGVSFGAVVLREQDPVAETGAFDWICRHDGSGVLDPADTNVRRGAGVIAKGHGGLTIEFESFVLIWQRHATGSGWIGNPPGCATYVCITRGSDFVGIDAADPRWVYQRTPLDGEWRFRLD